jgi:Tol biopolymer transport system component
LIKDNEASPHPLERFAFLTEKFDIIAFLVIMVLVAAIGAVIFRGDQVGLGVRTFGPADSAPSRTAITITFEEPIDAKTATQHFSIDPSIHGNLSISSSQITFQPSTSLPPNTTYTVTISPGLAASSGREVKHDFRWQFRVRQPRLIYLSNVDQIVQNLFAVDPTITDAPQQITYSQNGIVGYDVTPDGSKIVYSEIGYSEKRSYGVTDLFVMDMATGQTKLLYECNAACTHLAWRPDGGAVAFQRVDLGQSIGTGPSAPRVWLYDIATNTGHPLFDNNQILGYMPRWSPDGTKLAVYSASAGGILIHDFASNQNTTIPAANGEFGPFSPDGRWLYYPKIVMLGDTSAAVHYVLVDLSATPYTTRDLVPDTEAVSEAEAVWRADSQGLIIARQPPVRSPNEGSSLYNVDVTTGKATLLVPDEGTSQNSLMLSPAGDTIVFQRIAQGSDASQPQLWLYNLTSSTLKHIADKATLPGWLP